MAEIPPGFITEIQTCSILELATLRREMKRVPEDKIFLDEIDKEIKARALRTKPNPKSEWERGQTLVQCRDCGAVHKRIDGCPNDCHDESYG